MKNTKLIYTPKGVPLGEPVKREDGTFALRVKNGNKVDEVSIDFIIAALFEKMKNKM